MKRILYIANSFFTSAISISFTYRFLHTKPQRYLVKLKEQITKDTNLKVTNSWLNCNLQPTTYKGETYYGYPGELTIQSPSKLSSLHFFIIPKKKLVILKKQNNIDD